jgi:hypothetical protein
MLGDCTVHPELNHFVRQVVGIAAMALIPVILTAFVSFPLVLGHHPGEPPAALDRFDPLNLPSTAQPLSRVTAIDRK